MKSIRNVMILFATGAVLVNLLIIGFTCFSIHDSRLQNEDQAAISTRNLAQVLDDNIKGILDRVDLTLLTVKDEAERQIREGGINRQLLDSYIARQLERIPELDSLRMADANGDILYGTGVIKGINIADRDYFVSPRDDSQISVVISKPYLSRTTEKWQISISRRINRPDGSFYGIAYGNFTLTYFTKMFSAINMGTHGAISMWNTDLELIARYPEPRPVGSATELKLKSKAFNDSLLVSKEMGTYATQSNVDGTERFYSYRRIPRYPLYILIGVATQDYLAQWRKEALKKSALGLSFFLLSIFFTLLFYKYITDSKRAAEALQAQSLTDPLTGLYNRRGFFIFGEKLQSIARRQKKGLCMLFGDLDGLKRINDTWGHQEGDRALVVIANILKVTYRESDIVARLGGDEFAVIPVGTTGDDASIIIDRLQRNITAFNAGKTGGYKLSMSCGISCNDAESTASIDELISRADRLMYERKKLKGTLNKSS